jgi:hypothetical protein
MRANEFLGEYSYTDADLRAEMEQQGYTLLGEPGVDQTAYLEPGGTGVLKIFGTQRGHTGDDYTPDQKMFIYWADYCKKNKANPFLPKYSGWEPYMFDGSRYLKIKMEQLIKMPDALGMALEGLAHDSNRDRWRLPSGRKFAKNLRAADIGTDKQVDWHTQPQPSASRKGLNELIILLGQRKYNLLKRTIENLASMAQANGWRLDLHRHNYMMRYNSTPVIVDPWVVPN